MRWRAAACLAALALVASPSPARAWEANGVPVSRAPGGQTNPVIALDGSGGAFIAWSDYRLEIPGAQNIFLQHLTSSGTVAPGWPADGVPVCTAAGDQFAVSIALDGAGGALVGWLDSARDPGDVYLQRMTAAGVPAPGWPLNGLAVAIVPDQQYGGFLASDGAGGAFVAWDSVAVFTSGHRAYLQHVLGTGEIAPGWPAGGRPLSPELAYSGPAQVLADGAGGVLVAWGGRDAQLVSVGLHVQHLTLAGEAAPGWPSGGVVIPTSDGVSTIASDGGGGIYVGWYEYNATIPGGSSTSDVFAQHVTAAGAIASGWPADGLQLTNLPNSTQGDIRICADGLGGMCAVWQDDRTYPPQVYALRVGSDGQRMPGWPADGLLVASQPYFEVQPQVAPNGFGGMYVVWERFTGGYRAYAQHLSGTGVVAPGWAAGGVPLAPDVTGNQQYVQIAGDGLGMAIATWDDARTYSTTNVDVYAQKLATDGPVPVLLSLVSAEAQPDRAQLVWFAADRQVLTATVYRRTATTDWQALGAVTSDGTGRLTYEDRTVESGSRYAYRLGYADAATEFFTAETWLNIPSEYRLALEGLRPNPAMGDVMVSFSLPSAAPARLELLDVAGRRVSAREVGSLGAGSHRMRLNEGLRVPVGLYWVRLTQGDRTLTIRGVVAR